MNLFSVGLFHHSNLWTLHRAGLQFHLSRPIERNGDSRTRCHSEQPWNGLHFAVRNFEFISETEYELGISFPMEICALMSKLETVVYRLWVQSKSRVTRSDHPNTCYSEVHGGFWWKMSNLFWVGIQEVLRLPIFCIGFPNPWLRPLLPKISKVVTFLLPCGPNL